MIAIIIQRQKKVKLVVVEFSDYAITWWDQLLISKRRNRECLVETLDEMKSLMRRLFVPNHYSIRLVQKITVLHRVVKAWMIIIKKWRLPLLEQIWRKIEKIPWHDS